MARARKWKVGDFVYAAGSISGEYFVVQNGIILDIVDEGLHPIKVRLDRSNEVTYCRIAQLYKDPKKAKEAVTKNFEKLQAARIKEKAEQQAKEREKEIMEKLKISTTEEVPTISACLEKQNALPTFEEVADAFYSLAEIGEQGESHARDVVIGLAEIALFEKIKHGCVWGKDQ